MAEARMWHHDVRHYSVSESGDAGVQLAVWLWNQRVVLHWHPSQQHWCCGVAPAWLSCCGLLVLGDASMRSTLGVVSLQIRVCVGSTSGVTGPPCSAAYGRPPACMCAWWWLACGGLEVPSRQRVYML
jgi:hypothetical protein